MCCSRFTQQLIFILSWIIFSFQTKAQENFLEGKIFLKNGDSLSGVIDYRNWESNPKKIFFKEQNATTKNEYTPLDLLGFKVADEQYEGAIIKTEISPNYTADLGYEEVYIFGKDTVFLQTLIGGKKNLYLYTNFLGTPEYYIKTDTGFDLLHYKKYLIKDDFKYLIAEKVDYITQLQNYLNDCSLLNNSFMKMTYRQSALTKLFLIYYTCKGSQPNFIKKKDKLHYDLGIVGGPSLTSLQFKGATGPYQYLINSDFSRSTNMNLGLYLNIVLRRNLKKWSIYNELFYNAYNTTGNYFEYNDPNYYITTSTNLALSYLKINNLIRYSYHYHKTSFFANLGISNGFVIHATNERIVQTKFYNQLRIENLNALEDIRKYEQSIVLGLGVRYKNISSEIREEIGNGLTNVTGLASQTKRLYYLVGYRIH